jgi:hypothetical protein
MHRFVVKLIYRDVQQRAFLVFFAHDAAAQFIAR